MNLILGWLIKKLKPKIWPEKGSSKLVLDEYLSPLGYIECFRFVTLFVLGSCLSTFKCFDKWAKDSCSLPHLKKPLFATVGLVRLSVDSLIIFLRRSAFSIMLNESDNLECQLGCSKLFSDHFDDCLVPLEHPSVLGPIAQWLVRIGAFILLLVVSLLLFCLLLKAGRRRLPFVNFLFVWFTSWLCSVIMPNVLIYTPVHCELE